MLGEQPDRTISINTLSPEEKNAVSREVASLTGWEQRSLDVADFSPDLAQTKEAPRCFSACVLCAMQDWSEKLASVYLVGPQCTIPSPAWVADLLAADKYHARWPLIPRSELEASSVDFHHLDVDGSETTTKVLMHKKTCVKECVGRRGACPCVQRLPRCVLGQSADASEVLPRELPLAGSTFAIV